jgi:hypothetical protein
LIKVKKPLQYRAMITQQHHYPVHRTYQPLLSSSLKPNNKRPITDLASKAIPYSQDRREIGTKKLKLSTSRSNQLQPLKQPDANYLSQMPPEIRYLVTSFLSGRAIANLASTSFLALETTPASDIVCSHNLAPLFKRYFLVDPKFLSERAQAKTLNQLMTLCFKISTLERIKTPNYHSVKYFFQVVEARNLLKMLYKTQARYAYLLPSPRPDFRLVQDAEHVIQKAEIANQWLLENRHSLGSFHELDLSRVGLTLLPRQIVLFSQLIRLSLNHNVLTVLPQKLFQLPLRELFLRHNRIESIPPAIWSLKNSLTCLVLSQNQIRSLSTITPLHNLIMLMASGNKIRRLPYLGHMVHLSRLEVNDNFITYLHENLGLLPHLRSGDGYFAFRRNYITHVPKTLRRYRNQLYTQRTS